MVRETRPQEGRAGHSRAVRRQLRPASTHASRVRHTARSSRKQAKTRTRRSLRRSSWVWPRNGSRNSTSRRKGRSLKSSSSATAASFYPCLKSSAHRQIFSQAGKDENQKITKAELVGLAEKWFEKLDLKKEGQVTQEQFVGNCGQLLPMPQEFGTPPDLLASRQRREPEDH